MLLARVSEGIGDFVPEMLEHGFILTVSWKGKCALKNKQKKQLLVLLSLWTFQERSYFEC